MRETREAEAANRMYWESDDSVADIAARFDLSRRALYQAVEPLPTGRLCQVCGAEMVFENRLARRNGAAACPSCGAGLEITTEAEVATKTQSADDAAERDLRNDGARGDVRTGDMRQRAVLLSGAALAGIAIGGVATWLARRRD